ncbi:serine/threonine protein kinase, STE family, PAK/STE20-related [Calycina marina]|uniref:non-specific serine/threonine protein kinase n=1 Tax=Calycina marina TaxID=1763456 RepID=A0A9P7ZB69_9HELO|nr:serine/threonine protein kinase, STE family, PAK/STE20-related [Calycina marina]
MSLQPKAAEITSVKAKAIEDAKCTQKSVEEACEKARKPPPKYALLELIGKGSFGRVYKSKDMKTAQTVAVKIIDIDEADTINPRQANAYADFLKEVQALKLLSENKARNINHVIEALPVNQTMWMITEYCGGGSIATLMKPTPKGLQEKWIITIVREVAEAMKWVHEAGIIHRDLKCANVLVTEDGCVQLCDFGVSGIMGPLIDKRSTVVGTPHWMAPELFSTNSTLSYGKEVDIWAFGAMIFEMATGLPPMARAGISAHQLASYLQRNTPRLEGEDYSQTLRDLVAYCMEERPTARPTIEQVQMHPYIHNTASRYPMLSLQQLVQAFKVWVDRGGSRKSLFMAGGAQGIPLDGAPAVPEEEWNFSTSADFVLKNVTAEDVYEAYGTSVELEGVFSEQTSRPAKSQAMKSRRRPPPEALARLPAQPLEKIFDPNTMTNYVENGNSYYGRQPPQSMSGSDLPLRDDSAQTSIKDTMIDVGGREPNGAPSSFSDMDTIKASNPVHKDIKDKNNPLQSDFSRPPRSDPTEPSNNRKTMDWTFPSAIPASANPEVSRFPNVPEMQLPAVTPGSGARPTLVHHPTEPLGTHGGFGDGMASAQRDRVTLFDLDMSMIPGFEDFGDPGPAITSPVYDRPSTAMSGMESDTSDFAPTPNQFELEKHAFGRPPREPSVYVTDEYAAPSATQLPSKEAVEGSDFSASDSEGYKKGYAQDGFYDSDYTAMAPPPRPRPFSRLFPDGNPPVNRLPGNCQHERFGVDNLPSMPAPPSTAAMTGQASLDELADELKRMLGGTMDQLEALRDAMESPQVRSQMAPNRTSANARRGRNGRTAKPSGSKPWGGNGKGSGGITSGSGSG